MEGIDQEAFAVGLQNLELHPTGAGPISEGLIDLGERSGSVDLRLSTTEEIEVWTV